MHEQPSEATSWSSDEMTEVAMLAEVGLATIDMCACGMTLRDGDEVGFARNIVR